MDEWLMTDAEAGRQADAILRLEGHEPGKFSRKLRAADDARTIMAQECRVAVIARARKANGLPPLDS